MPLFSPGDILVHKGFLPAPHPLHVPRLFVLGTRTTSSKSAEIGFPAGVQYHCRIVDADDSFGPCLWLCECELVPYADYQAVAEKARQQFLARLVDERTTHVPCPGGRDEPADCR